jgi:hypothetical protein
MEGHILYMRVLHNPNYAFRSGTKKGNNVPLLFILSSNLSSSSLFFSHRLHAQTNAALSIDLEHFYLDDIAFR